MSDPCLGERPAGGGLRQKEEREVALKLIAVVAGSWLLAVPTAWSGEVHSLERLALAATEEDATVAARAIAALRQAGPAGLEALFEAHAAELQKASKAGAVWTDPAWRRLKAAIEAVAAQRDAHVSRLYWYTDFDEALAAARRSGRPILSLRLLGRLDEEASCANSRYFRTVLYANAEVSRALRERFVLHWRSVRPVPRITLDMGDGRRIERTITGNSAHFVLDARGRVTDALPGLYGPQAFLRVLSEAEERARATVGFEGQGRRVALAASHRRALAALDDVWARAGSGEVPSGSRAPSRPPTAADAAGVAVAKSLAERPLVRALSASGLGEAARSAEDVVLARLAKRIAPEVRLDDASRALVARKHVRMPGSATGVSVDDVIQRFEASLAEDTARNEYVLHRRLHAWFAAREVDEDAERLADRVYTELFLTPPSDPWLGLAPSDAYAALEAPDANGPAPGEPPRTGARRRPR